MMWGILGDPFHIINIWISKYFIMRSFRNSAHSVIFMFFFVQILTNFNSIFTAIPYFSTNILRIYITNFFWTDCILHYGPKSQIFGENFFSLKMVFHCWFFRNSTIFLLIMWNLLEIDGIVWENMENISYYFKTLNISTFLRVFD
jgi:hypothetical protein